MIYVIYQNLFGTENIIQSKVTKPMLYLIFVCFCNAFNTNNYNFLYQKGNEKTIKKEMKDHKLSKVGYPPWGGGKNPPDTH